jgi:tRNA pseudouridine55 synthase
VRVNRFETDPTDDPAVVVARVTCSAGTFVRSLGADLAEALGTVAHIRGLRRTRVGPYRIEECGPVDTAALVSPWDAVRTMPRVTVDADGASDVAHGRPLPCWDGDGPWAVAAPDGALVAVYESWRDGLAKPAVVLGAM